MEIHHQHHHDHPQHKEKLWVHYAIEFFMLFLAVSAGFFTENFREQLVERSREKRFIVSLVEDLKSDIKSLDTNQQEQRSAVLMMDSLFFFLNNPDLAKVHGDDFYYYARLGPRFGPFANNSETFDQLKNSGGFRLIRDPKITDAIMSYYLQFPHYHDLEGLYVQEFEDYKRAASKVVDPAIFRLQELPDGNIARGTNNPALRTYNSQPLKEMGLWVVYLNGTRRSIIVLDDELKVKANKIILLLQKEYDMK
jgi:hypothetical protein